MDASDFVTRPILVLQTELSEGIGSLVATNEQIQACINDLEESCRSIEVWLAFLMLLMTSDLNHKTLKQLDIIPYLTYWSRCKFISNMQMPQQSLKLL